MAQVYEDGFFPDKEPPIYWNVEAFILSKTPRWMWEELKEQAKIDALRLRREDEERERKAS